MSEILELARGPRGGDLFTVSIDELTEKGLGRAQISAVVGPGKQPHTYQVQVHRAIPGDVVRVRVERYRKKIIVARVEEVIEPSPMRVAPHCAHFGFRSEAGRGCGGCVLQSMDYRHQLMVKEQLVKRLIRQGGHDPGLVAPVMGSPSPWYYRNKMEYSFGDSPDVEIAVGLHPSGYRYDVLPLQECWLQSSFAAACLPALTAWVDEAGLRAHVRQGDGGWLLQLMVREGKRTGERLIELMTTAADTVLYRGEETPAAEVAEALTMFLVKHAEASGHPITSLYWTTQHAQRGQRTQIHETLLSGRETLRETLELPGGHALSFEVHPRAFFQPNTLGAEQLYAQALEAAGVFDEGCGLALDLYCGTGTIGLCLAPYVERVVGIELNAEAVENARGNAQLNGIENAEFFVGDVGEVLAREAFSGIDLVVVDPPRAGLFEQARRELAKIQAPRLVYVSCNPKSLARDLVDLKAAGYVVDSIQPVDMFPHTRHIENVATLRWAP